MPPPEMTATGRNTSSSIAKPRSRPCVRTIVPARDRVGRRRVAVLPAHAAGRRRRLDPLARRRELAGHLDRDRDGLRRDRRGPRGRPTVASGSARDDELDRADGLDLRASTVMSAAGQEQEAPATRRGAERRRSAQQARDAGPPRTRRRGFDAPGSARLAADDRVELRLAGRRPSSGSGRRRRGRWVAGRAAGGRASPPRPRRARRGSRGSGGRRHRLPLPRAAAAAPAAGGRARVAGSARRRPSSGASSAASYSPTDANTGMPAEAARARAEASGATMSSRLPLTIASRASSRKLIREVATRDPNGTTTATRVSAAARIRAAAEVISSSASR